jgi:hypothetical protein
VTRLEGSATGAVSVANPSRRPLRGLLRVRQLCESDSLSKEGRRCLCGRRGGRSGKAVEGLARFLVGYRRF